MPRNGSGVMSWPPNTQGVPNTTVSSTRYNAFLADLLADLNAARPVSAGGTGGNTAVSGNDGLNTTGTDMLSAATLNLANATGVVVNVTGTTTITSLGTVNSGAQRTLVFAGALILTHHATNLILPGAANITTAAGDVAVFRSKGAGNWVCVGYQRASGGLTVNTLVQPTLSLKQSAAPVPTAEGAVEWDTDDNVLAVGDGAVTRTFVPIPASTAAGDLEYFTSAKVKARLAKGTAGQILQMNSGATAPEWADKFLVGSPVTLNGASAYLVTGAPVWANEITIVVNGATAASGNNNLYLQIGDGAIRTTGYIGIYSNNNNTGSSVTTAFVPSTPGSVQFVVTLKHIGGNTWSQSGIAGYPGSGFGVTSVGVKTLAGTLDRFQLSNSGGINFTAGTMTPIYRS